MITEDFGKTKPDIKIFPFDKNLPVGGIPVKAGDSIGISLNVAANRQSILKRLGKIITPTALVGALASRSKSKTVDASQKTDPALLNVGLTAAGSALANISRGNKTQLYVRAYDKAGRQIQSRTQMVRRKQAQATLTWKATQDGFVSFSAQGERPISVNSLDAYMYSQGESPVITPVGDPLTPECTCWILTIYQDGVPISSEVLGCSGCGGGGGTYETADDNQPGTATGHQYTPTPEPFDDSPIPVPGKKYTKERACEVYKAMWERSKALNKEQAALLTDKGIIYIPDHSNTESSFQIIYTTFINPQDPNGPRYIEIGGERYTVLGTVHTHPTGSKWEDNPSEADYRLSDRLNVPGFVLADEGIHKYNGNGGRSNYNLGPRYLVMNDCNRAMNLYGQL